MSEIRTIMLVPDKIALEPPDLSHLPWWAVPGIRLEPE
jgi:hypothetical protein